jgi:hypothetical protein
MFFLFLHKATERLMYTVGLHQYDKDIIITKFYCDILLVEHQASLPSVWEKFARGVSRTVTPRYRTPKVQSSSWNQSSKHNGTQRTAKNTLASVCPFRRNLPLSPPSPEKLIRTEPLPLFSMLAYTVFCFGGGIEKTVVICCGGGGAWRGGGVSGAQR